MRRSSFVMVSGAAVMACALMFSGCGERFDPYAQMRATHAQLLGNPAPELDLELLDGGRVSLQEHHGEVVILDFWATWCGPCVRGLPIVAGVAERYRDEGVVFYAVNIREEPETVRAFLRERDLDLRVPMDHTAAVSWRYGVGPIPQTMLIGRDGTLQVVHVGLLRDLEERLSREIEALLAGERLAGG